MPCTISLTAMPGHIEYTDKHKSSVIEIMGKIYAKKTIVVNKVSEIPAQVKEFGQTLRDGQTDLSFYISVSLGRGQRKPNGYDAADKAGQFGEKAFMLVKEPEKCPASA